MNYLSMTANDRIDSIDIMKGLALILMIFFTDLLFPVLPGWYAKLSASPSYSGILNPAFYIFLFASGMTIPFAIAKRINNGLQQIDIVKQILARTIVYLLIGVLMINAERVEPVMTGFGPSLWGLIMFVAVFLVWNRYPDSDKKFFTVTGLRFAGLAVLVFLVFKFRSGTLENNGSLITGWWGIIGMIGWGYLIGSLTCIAAKKSILSVVVMWLAFFTLHILSNLGMAGFLDRIKPYFGVVSDGYVPFITLSGVIASMLIRRFPAEESGKLVSLFAGSGLLMIAAEYFLKDTSALSDHLLIYTGASLIIFAIIFFIAEMKKIRRWSSCLRPAWESSLTAYVILFFLYNLFALIGLPLVFYKDPGNQFLAIGGSAVLTAIVILITALLNRLNIRLKI
jgi:heparan-alpha-glucosaminide N-acetyltransferase